MFGMAHKGSDYSVVITVVCWSKQCWNSPCRWS